MSDVLTASIQYSLDHRAEAVQHALQYARDMGRDLADKFVGMYVNHWTLDYGEKGREVDPAISRGRLPSTVDRPSTGVGVCELRRCKLVQRLKEAVK